jgi:hypothetical protein
MVYETFVSNFTLGRNMKRAVGLGLAAAIVAGAVTAHQLRTRAMFARLEDEAAVPQRAKSQSEIDEITAMEPKTRKIMGIPWRLQPDYKTSSNQELMSRWEDLDENGRERTVRVLEARLSHRGRSYGGLQVLMALVAAVEAAIIVFNVGTGLLEMQSVIMGWSAIIAIMGLIFLCIGVLPLRNEVIPQILEDEGEDAIEKSERYGFGYFMELRGRSTHQRRVLWRSRVWFFASVLATILGLVLVIVGIFQRVVATLM